MVFKPEPADLALQVMGYLRTADGFVTSMHETVAQIASQDGYRYEVVFFNPASNVNQESRLRVVNRSDAEAAVTITGLDDGAGRWRLTVASDQPLAVMSLLQSPTGHLTNLSTAPPASR